VGDRVVSSKWQASLNTFGQDYNPGRDFFVLWIRNPEAVRAWIGENACMVGLQAMLVDPATDEGVT
jgi:hypothetical protein